MSKLEHVANLRRELGVLLDKLMEESALALFARWMLEKRSKPSAPCRNGRGQESEGSKQAHRVLEQFFSLAPLVAEGGVAAKAPAGQPPGDVSARAELGGSPSGSGGGDDAGRAQAPGERSAGRSQRHVERRHGRGNRIPGRTDAGGRDWL